MLKTTFSLPNGTLVTIEGIQEDVQNLLDYYSKTNPSHSIQSKRIIKHVTKPSQKAIKPKTSEIPPDTHIKIVNLIRSCSEAEAIEKTILETKPSEGLRVLLPLYIVYEYFENSFGLTTVEIEAITAELGKKVMVRRQNTLRALKTTISKYVLGDRARKVGTGTHYTLNERGFKYIKSVLNGNPS